VHWVHLGAWGQEGPGDTLREYQSRRDRIRFTVRSAAQVRGTAGLALHCKVLPKREGTSHAFPSRAHSARLSPSLAFAARPPHDAEKWASAESSTRTSTRVLLRVVSRQPQEDNLTLQANSVSSRFLSRAQARAKHTCAPPEGVQDDVCLPYRGGCRSF